MAKVTNERLFREAQQYLVGGVNSPVRAFRAVGGTPLFIEKGKGPWLFDASGKRYIDYCLSWGALILGHANGRVIKRVSRVASRGMSFGAPTRLETQLARKISKAIPSIEKIRFTSSGTEAVMSAVRLARAYTGKDMIVKFEGCYHGHADAFLAGAGSGALTFGIPASAGVPREVVKNTVVIPYNSLDAIAKVERRWAGKIAVVIVEPVAANMGVILPEPGFLKGLKAFSRRVGAVLIFDEVITGFRLCYGGAGRMFGVESDLVTLGKIIGGGMPVGAFGGKERIMRLLAPEGPVYQAGTLSGNPVAMAAGLETLSQLEEVDYARLEQRAERLASRLEETARKFGSPVAVSSIGSMFTVFFMNAHPRTLAEARTSDTLRFSRFHRALLDGGVYFPPSNFEGCFLSSVHTDTLIEKTIRVAKRFFEEEGRSNGSAKKGSGCR